MVQGIGNKNGLSLMQGIRSGPTQEQKDEMFKKMDRDGNGKVTQEEMKVTLSEMGKKMGATVQIENLFTNADTDGDGALAQSELDTAMKNMPPPPPPGGQPPPPPDTGKIFQDTDEDSDGLISLEELMTSLEDLSDKTGANFDVESLFSQADADGDGKLTETEFKTAMESIHEQMKAQFGEMAPPPEEGNTAANTSSSGQISGTDLTNKINQYLNNLKLADTKSLIDLNL